MLPADAIPLEPLLDTGRHFVPAQYAIYYGVLLGLWRMYRNGHRFKALEGRVARLERERTTPMAYNLTQVPAHPRNWGLSLLPNGVPGRLWYKVDKIVIHWINGDLALADAAFTNPDRRASAHFGVEDGEVHQYVSVKNVAWHCGSWLGNLTSVGIEHSASPGRDLSDASYETSAQLICDVCRALGLVPSRSLLRGHREFKPTQCPGTIDLDRLARRAVEIWQGGTQGIDQAVPQGPAQPAVPASVTVPIRFKVRHLYRANWRNEPTTASGVFATYGPGTEVWCTGTVAGQDPYGTGNATWYESERSGKFVWSGAVKKLN